MDPVTWTALAATATAMAPEIALGSAALGAVGTGVAAYGQSEAMKAQAQADRQRADIEGQWAERRAQEAQAAGQREAANEKRKAALAQSRLTALSGASGTAPGDETIMNLWGDIAKEGDYNAAAVTAGADQKASGMRYQAGLDAWSADANAKIKNSAANTTLISGLLSAGGQMAGGMSRRYGGPATEGTRRYG